MPWPDKKYICLLLSLVCWFAAPSLSAEDAPLEAEETEESRVFRNPHWKEGLCGECHAAIVERGKPQRFNYNNDINLMCDSCHAEISAHAYIHASGMVPSDQIMKNMSENFKKALYRGDKEGKVTCIVCHDLPFQCLTAEFWRRTDNPRFFRGGPYESRTGLCYKCHDASKYQRLNPHDQIDHKGYLDTEKCIYCHTAVPDRRNVKSIKDVTFPVVESLSNICSGCHRVSYHPTWIGAKGKEVGIKEHLVSPSRETYATMKKSESSFNIILPLEPKTEKIFCCTCHNPHELGVQRNPKADAGADGYKRLRLARGVKVLCVMCHDTSTETMQ